MDFGRRCWGRGYTFISFIRLFKFFLVLARLVVRYLQYRSPYSKHSHPTRLPLGVSVGGFSLDVCRWASVVVVFRWRSVGGGLPFEVRSRFCVGGLV